MINIRTHFYYPFIIVSLVATSCTKVVQKPVLPYFQDSTMAYPVTVKVTNPPISVIQNEDLLGITVSSLNKESNDILNFSNINSLSLSNLPGGGGGGQQPVGYPVDPQGNISMAFIGKVNVVGLTLEQAQDTISKALEVYLKNPAVNIRFMNHRYTVLGEVKSVGSYNLLDDRTTLIDALAAAGDLTDYSKRDSVTVIREINGQRQIGKFNLLNRDIFSSPYYYVRNGDVIYVEPIKEKQIRYEDATNRDKLTVLTTILSTATTLVTIIITLSKIN